MYPLLALITLISAGGMLLTLKKTLSHRVLSLFVAFGAGSMLAIALLHIFPEAIAHSPYGAFAFLWGFVIMYVFEELFSPHKHDHKHQDHSHEDPHEHSHHIALVSFFAIFIHTLFDGMAIRAGLVLSDTLSYAIVIGVAIHQLPISFSLAALLKKSQLSKRVQYVLMIAFSSAVAIGFLLSDILFSHIASHTALIAAAIAGGSLLYIASVDLLPMTHAENTKKLLSLIAFLWGIALMIALQIFGEDFHAHHHNHSHEETQNHSSEDLHDHHEDLHDHHEDLHDHHHSHAPFFYEA